MSSLRPCDLRMVSFQTRSLLSVNCAAVIFFFRWDRFLQQIENSCSYPSSAFFFDFFFFFLWFLLSILIFTGSVSALQCQERRGLRRLRRCQGPSMWCRYLEGIFLHGKGQKKRPGAHFELSQLWGFTAELAWPYGLSGANLAVCQQQISPPATASTPCWRWKEQTARWVMMRNVKIF